MSKQKQKAPQVANQGPSSFIIMATTGGEAVGEKTAEKNPEIVDLLEI